MNAFCPRCGKPTQPTDEYCRNCGHHLIDEEAARPEEPVEPTAKEEGTVPMAGVAPTAPLPPFAPSAPPPSPSAGQPPWLPVAMVGGVVLVGALVVFLVLGGNEEPAPVVPIAELPVAGPTLTPASLPTPAVEPTGRDEEELLQLFANQAEWFSTGNGQDLLPTLTPEAVDACSRDEFFRAIESAGGIYGEATFTPDEIRVDGDSAQIDYVLVTTPSDPSDDPFDSTMYYVRSSGAWLLEQGYFTYGC